MYYAEIFLFLQAMNVWLLPGSANIMEYLKRLGTGGPYPQKCLGLFCYTQANMETVTSHFDEEVIQIMAEEETVLRDPHLDALIGCHVTSEIVVKCVRQIGQLVEEASCQGYGEGE